MFGLLVESPMGISGVFKKRTERRRVNTLLERMVLLDWIDLFVVALLLLLRDAGCPLYMFENTTNLIYYTVGTARQQFM